MIKYATKLALVLLICVLPASASALTEKQSIELKILKAKVAEHPDNVEYLKNVGRFYQNKLHDYITAFKYYDAYALMNYGYFLYDKRGEQDEALEVLSNAIKYKPKYAPPYEHRAYLYRTYYNDCEKAILDLDKAISLDSKRKNAYYGRYECYNKMSKLDEAHADLKKYIELVPDSQKAISNLEELEGKIK